MAYSEAFGMDPDAHEPVSAAAPRIMGWLGALSSAALMAGLAFWVHDLATRDARSVPVVRALEGPSRVKPEDPGGFTAAHQGLAVNSVASDMPGDVVGEQIVLAPRTVGPAPDDIAAPAAAPAPVDPATSLRNAIDGALSEVLGLDAPVSVPDAAESAPAPAAKSGGPRPSPRPDADIVTRAATGPSLPDLAPRPVSVDPALIAPGTRLVQLGSFSSPSVAETEWARLSGQFSDYLRNKSRVVEPAEHGGLVVYRLQAMGFDSLSDARSFCAVLLAEKADCIPVLTR
jgi:hypothetical protein